MNRLASPAQLRASLIRWSLFLVPTVCLLGFLSGQLSGSGADNAWFVVLEKPGIYPPPIAFPIVWSTLYIMMGFAAALVAAAWGSRYRVLALLAFVFQLALNLAWSPMFFAAHDIRAAMAVIVLLDAALVITIILFWRVRPAAGVLLLPYLAWVLFASVLNWQFLVLNPQAEYVESSNAVQRIELN